MNYTDKVLIRASQIAYFQINYDAIKEVRKIVAYRHTLCWNYIRII